MGLWLQASTKAFFDDGPGGTGKTFLYLAIFATARAGARCEGKYALVVASSTLAASLLPGATTAHSRFEIPVLCHEDSISWCVALFLQCCSVAHS